MSTGARQHRRAGVPALTRAGPLRVTPNVALAVSPLVFLLVSLTPAWASGLVPVQVRGDGIDVPLAAAGNPARGRAIVADRQQGLCLLCHSAPIAEERFQGTLAPPLAGAGARYTEAQLRLRVVDIRRVHPDSLMPAFHSTDGLTRVGRAWQGRPVLSPQQVEDVVAWLTTLR